MANGSYLDPVKRAKQELEEIRTQMKAETGSDTEAIPDGSDTGTEGGGGKVNMEAPDGDAAKKNGDQPGGDSHDKRKAEDDEDPAVWKQRYLSLRGLFNRRLEESTADLRTRISALEQENTQLKSSSATSSDEGESVGDKLNLLKDRYGDEFAEAVSEMFSTELSAQLGPLKRDVDEFRAENSKAKFATKMSELCPEWPEINVSPDFAEWLEEFDPISARSYRELLMEAFNAGNAGRTAAIFNIYKTNSIAKNKQGKGGNGNRPDASGKNEKKAMPESLIQPEARGTGYQSIAENSQGKVWTMAEVTEFYHKAELGKLDLKTIRETEAEIRIADSEGRIIG